MIIVNELIDEDIVGMVIPGDIRYALVKTPKGWTLSANPPIVYSSTIKYPSMIAAIRHYYTADKGRRFFKFDTLNTRLQWLDRKINHPGYEQD